MRIKSIHLKDFKRFTDLLIKGIPETAKLVVVVGPNGCGKSSLFDGIWYAYRSRFAWLTPHAGDHYYRKERKKSFGSDDIANIELHGDSNFEQGSVYMRTAYRHDPNFNISQLNHQPDPSSEPQILTLMQIDKTVADNYIRLVMQTVAGVYNEENDSKKVKDLRGELIGAVQYSMGRVFDDLLLEDISDPLDNGTFCFTKGAAQSYDYQNLSGGEKSAFDLILDLHIKKPYHPEAIYCIDETETHLHTRVQGKLVKELVNIIPEEGQLWITTHSLGVLRACQEIKMETPESVAIIDFHDINPDEATELTPTSLGRLTWNKFLSIALDGLSEQIVPETIILCEGSPNGKGSRENFDAEIYSKIFDEHALNIQFISAGSSSEVDKTAQANKPIIQAIATKTRLITLIDRDERSKEEIEKRAENGDLVLTKRNLESYLFADEVLEKLAQKKGKPECFKEIQDKKHELLQASGKQHDDFKPIAGKLYNALKEILDLTQCGSNSDAFMSNTLAPLITPETDTYKELKAIIIDGTNAKTN